MGAEPVVLAIEASQRSGGVALCDRDGRVHVEGLDTSRRHDDDLLPAIDRLYARAGLAPADTGAVAVSVGPGGFTGLRIAVSTAKMLAEALGSRLVAVPSALVAAEPSRRRGPIIVALASKEATAWLTPLRRDAAGHWTIDGTPRLGGAADLALPGPEAVLADRYLPPPLRDACAAAGVPVDEPRFEAAACLAVARRLVQHGRFIDATALAPLYPRPPSAVTQWKGP